MKFYKLSFISVLIILLASCTTIIDAKKHRKHTRSSSSGNTKTKTKWSSSSEMGRNAGQLVNEEHGYYVKRTFLPLNDSAAANLATPQSPPYLGIPIAWYPCEGGEACTKANTAIVSGSTAALLDGFLCDDDCSGPYEPICGKTPSELAVFYNKCKLNVAKCRTHGLWLDVPYEECKKSNPNEVADAERKFKRSPFFRNIKSKKTVVTLHKKQPHKDKDDSSEEDTIMDVAILALDNIGEQIAEAEAEALGEAASGSADTDKTEAVKVPPVHEQSKLEVQSKPEEGQRKPEGLSKPQVQSKPHVQSKPEVLSNPKRQSKPDAQIKPEAQRLPAAQVPAKEINAFVKPLKPTLNEQQQKAVAENSVNKPVESVNSKSTASFVAQPQPQAQLLPAAVSNDVKPVVQK